MYTLPIDWSEFGRNGSDSVTFLRPGHTVKEPRLMIVDRKAPSVTGQGGFSVPTYRVRFIDGHVDVDGVPVKERSIVEINIRQPVNASNTAITASLAAAATMLGNVEFVNDATVDFMFPREA